MQTFDFQTPETIELKIDLGGIEARLNTNLNKITAAIKYLLSKVHHYENTHSLNSQLHSVQQQTIEKQQQQIDQYKNNHQSIYNELFIEGKDKDRVSRIHIIENEITKIKDVMGDDPSFSRTQSRNMITLVEGEQRGNTRNRNRGNERDRDEGMIINNGSNTRQGSRDMKKLSRVGSRKRITNDVDQFTKQQSRSLHSSAMQRMGSQKYHKVQQDSRQPFSEGLERQKPISASQKLSPLQKEASQLQKKIQSQLEQLIRKKMKELETSYEGRFQFLEKHHKIPKNRNKQINIENKEDNSKKSIEMLNNLESSYDNRSESDGSTEIDEMKLQINEMNNKIRKQEQEQKEIMKKSNDVLIKFEKNHQRVTAALRFLEKNINNIYEKLKDADIITEQDTIVDMSEKTKKTGGSMVRNSSRISKISGFGEIITPNENMSNRIQVMSNLMRNIEEQLQEMRYCMGKLQNKGYLPKIDDRQNVGKMRDISMNSQHHPHVNLRIQELESTVDKMKVKIKSLTETVNEFPLKIIQLSSKIREQGEIRQQRLVELIKQLINRALLDPFNNHFTNHLRKQIYVKFLQIKHEYSAILKEIQKKVEDRADRKQIDYINAKNETVLLEMRSIMAKKTDMEDYKKWNKFVEAKLKELFEMIRTSEGNQYKLIQEHTLSIKKKT